MTEGFCPKIHRYVIATDKGISPIFHEEEKARDYLNDLPRDLMGVWVVFHEVSIEQLVNYPNDIMTYCAQETTRAETKVDITKRS